MYLYQQQLLANTRHAQGTGPRPTSPRLAPLASPGAVTPLELEDEAGGYITAGMSQKDAVKHVENLIRNESLQRGEIPHGRTSMVSSS